MAYGFLPQTYIHFTDEEAEDPRGCMMCLWAQRYLESLKKLSLRTLLCKLPSSESRGFLGQEDKGQEGKEETIHFPLTGRGQKLRPCSSEQIDPS